MPKFIDAHPMNPFKADELNELQNAPPNAEAIEKHHAKAGIKCEFIHEVKSTRG